MNNNAIIHLIKTLLIHLLFQDLNYKNLDLFINYHF